MAIKTAIFIPARLGSTRLPNKPLADINGKPMIIHVALKAIKANIGKVYIAAAEQEIVDIAQKYGINAILTDPNLPSGTDRVFEAVIKNGENFDIIINLQGDLPLIDPQNIITLHNILKNSPHIDISTLASKITNLKEKTNPNVVKAVFSHISTNNNYRALYFTRCPAPYGDNDLYHHIGIYGFWFKSLEKFVTLPPSHLEKIEKLEQLRALENNMHIQIALVDSSPLGVDTKEDLELARKIFSKICLDYY